MCVCVRVCVCVCVHASVCVRNALLSTPCLPLAAGRMKLHLTVTLGPHHRRRCYTDWDVCVCVCVSVCVCKLLGRVNMHDSDCDWP